MNSGQNLMIDDEIDLEIFYKITTLIEGGYSEFIAVLKSELFSYKVPQIMARA